MTGDTHELQFKRSPAQKWFLGLYHRTSAPILDAQKSFSNDSQGMYIAGPDGTTYGYCNDHSPVNIQAVMDAALKRYRAHPPGTVEIAPMEMVAPFAITPRDSTSVVRVFARIRPVPKGCTPLNQSIGRDYLWVYCDEVRQMLASDPKKSFKMPAALSVRIARYHLLDDVRGTPDMWTGGELQKLSIHSRITQDSANTRRVEFDGQFALRTRSGRKGYEGRIEGEIILAKATASVQRFRAYASGQAWGDGFYTPNAPRGRYNLAIAFVEARDPVARIVPPEAVSTENNDAAYRMPQFPGS